VEAVFGYFVMILLQQKKSFKLWRAFLVQRKLIYVAENLCWMLQTLCELCASQRFRFNILMIIWMICGT